MKLPFGTIAFACCWGSVAMAQGMTAEPSTGTLVGYGVMAAIAITPTIGLLLKLGRDVGKYEARQEHLTQQLTTLTAQLQASVAERRSELASFIAESHRAREDQAREARAAREEFNENLKQLSAEMVPRELSVLQLQALATKIENDVLRSIKPNGARG